MALALSLECTLFWEFYAAPGCRKKGVAKRLAATDLLGGQETSSQAAWEWQGCGANL